MPSSHRKFGDAVRTRLLLSSSSVREPTVITGLPTPFRAEIRQSAKRRRGPVYVIGSGLPRTNPVPPPSWTARSKRQARNSHGAPPPVNELTYDGQRNSQPSMRTAPPCTSNQG